MTAKAQIYPSKRGLLRRKQWMCRIVASNGYPLFRSTESYNNRVELVEITEDTFPGMMIEELDAAGEVVRTF